jgi:hypothetical protein
MYITLNQEYWKIPPPCTGRGEKSATVNWGKNMTRGRGRGGNARQKEERGNKKEKGEEKAEIKKKKGQISAK